MILGRYAAAVARMERTGVPIDAPLLGRLRENWDGSRGGRPPAQVTKVEQTIGQQNVAPAGPVTYLEAPKKAGKGRTGK